MVGYAMAALPAGSDVPWQRVINARGEVSARSGGGGTARQRERLEAEGVYFDARGRVDLARAGWDGPPAQWLARHGFHATAPRGRRADAVVPGAPARRARRML
jgi:methylated-DNA-protein-cysteine methyltransferase-like protein